MTTKPEATTHNVIVVTHADGTKVTATCLAGESYDKAINHYTNTNTNGRIVRIVEAVRFA